MSPFILPLTPVTSRDSLRRAVRDGGDASRAHEEEYDFSTVFYDVAWNEDASRIDLLGPPLLDFAEMLRIGPERSPLAELITPGAADGEVADAQDSIASAWASPKAQRLSLSPELLNAEGLLELRIGAEEFAVRPRPSIASVFEGANAVYTWNCAGDTARIEDWARFQRRSVGADALVVYDVRTDGYSQEELLDALAAGFGSSETCIVVDWDFPFGPRSAPWEDLYTPAGVLEHGRFELFPLAASVLHARTDEYVLRSGPPLNEAAADDPIPIAIDGYEVEEALLPSSRGARASVAQPVRVVDFGFADRGSSPAPRPLYIPSALPLGAYFTENALEGTALRHDRALRFARIRGLAEAGEGPAFRAERRAPKEARWIDPLLIDRLRAVFPEDFDQDAVRGLWADQLDAVLPRFDALQFAQGYVTRALGPLGWDKQFLWRRRTIVLETSTSTPDGSRLKVQFQMLSAPAPRIRLSLTATSALGARAVSRALSAPDAPPWAVSSPASGAREFVLAEEPCSPDSLPEMLDGMCERVRGIRAALDRRALSAQRPGAPRAEGVFRILRPKAVEFPQSSGLFRTPPVEREAITADYLARHDGLTLFSDVFIDGGELIAIGPPRLNLREDVSSYRLSADGQPLGIPENAWQELNRVSRLRLPVDAPPDRLTISADRVQWEIQPGRGFRDLFAGRTAAVTLNRDNTLEAMHDWLTNFVVNHEVTAAIVYDNRSTLYGLEDVLDVLKSVPGLDIGFVVDWPQKFGMTGTPWTSDFGQYIAWEHARWRFLAAAANVYQSDIDEIPMTEDSRPIRAYLDEAPSGVVRYEVCDAPPVVRADADPDRSIRRCTDYLHLDTVRGRFSSKIAYQPLRIPEDAQVLNHSVSLTQQDIEPRILARHIRGTHLGWRRGSSEFDFPERPFNPSTEMPDPFAEQWYRRTFPDRFTE
ncbi:hypothetical protein [Schaalia hyovaginalis]|uniref:hypothetical protein n=1 Tax=Schaalia hyovaginalis TaxID=29316 RepID=UPI0026EB98F1|nr:hypothetical protein [Schaalia hyovaginalis]MCI6411316.1 hypothetical protein [Schaalia hyovaginalis]MCI7513003.1 hypothetical protein [Schaalia hyovaginalis]